MSKSTVLQMVGRAGRPGFDTTGTAVIMTSMEDRQTYSTLTLNVVESSLPGILVEGGEFHSPNSCNG
jgi:replicative superfamily II helicase